MGAAAPGGSTYQQVPIDLQGWNSPRGYACLGDDPPPCLGLFSGDVMQSGSKHRTGGKQDGLSIRATRGPLPAPRTDHTLDRQTGPRRCGVQHLSPAAAGLHLPPVCHPDLRYRLHPRRRPHRLRLVLGDSRRPARHQPLDGQLHPTQPDPRGTVNAGNHGMEAGGKA
jgi:hypothetical protein